MPIDGTELMTVALLLITSEFFDMWQPKSEFANFMRNFTKKKKCLKQVKKQTATWLRPIRL